MRPFGICRRIAIVAAATWLALLLPLAVAAHPLGNFTINHYAGLRIAADRISLDVVIDQAEIPTFQERQRIDSNGDGQVSEAELAAERLAACPRLAQSLNLAVGGSTVAPTVVAAGLLFPPGAGGLPTMRLVCEFAAPLSTRISALTTVHFEDRSNVERIGWREIVVQGDGVTTLSNYPTATASARLSAYPQALLATPLNVRSADVRVQAGGGILAPWTAPDAQPLTDLAGAAAGGVPPASGSGAVPGGVAGEISGLLGTNDLTPIVLVLSFLAAAALGAGHALTPGHGKTIMAAYLVGTRGSGRHALGLGLATAVSHTLGVLALAALIVLAGTALPTDRVYPILTAASGLIVVAIGAWLLAGQVRRWSRGRVFGRTSMVNAGARLPAAGLAGGVAFARSDSAGRPDLGSPMAGHAHDHDRPHQGGLDHPHDDHPVSDESPARWRDHDQGHSGGTATLPDGGWHASVQGFPDLTSHGTGLADVAPSAGTHRHGWRVHSHTPAQPGSLSWRGLFALGLSGGLVPSTNALIILVATVAAGKPAYGFVLVVAFGLGMAAVLVGVGLAMVYAAGRIGRSSHGAAAGRLLQVAPTIGAIAVVILGLYLTQQAIAGTPVL